MSCSQSQFCYYSYCFCNYKDQSNSYFFGIKDVNKAGGGLRDVALLNFTPVAQINRLNNILLGHFKEIGKIYCAPLGCLCILFIPSAP